MKTHINGRRTADYTAQIRLELRKSLRKYEKDLKEAFNTLTAKPINFSTDGAYRALAIGYEDHLGESHYDIYEAVKYILEES